MKPREAMNGQVELLDTGPVVDVSLIASAFDLDPTVVQDLMRARKITSRCERGVDKDAGRWRLTFWHSQRVLRLTVDKNGAILSQVCFPTHRQRRQSSRTDLAQAGR